MRKSRAYSRRVLEGRLMNGDREIDVFYRLSRHYIEDLKKMFKILGEIEYDLDNLKEVDARTVTKAKKILGKLDYLYGEYDEEFDDEELLYHDGSNIREVIYAIDEEIDYQERIKNLSLSEIERGPLFFHD